MSSSFSGASRLCTERNGEQLVKQPFPVTGNRQCQWVHQITLRECCVAAGGDTCLVEAGSVIVDRCSVVGIEEQPLENVARQQ
jgi:hypothetical protein